MNTVTLPRVKYQELKRKAASFELISSVVGRQFFFSPPVKDIATIIGEFKNSKLYSPKFLAGLKRGLTRSSYFKA